MVDCISNSFHQHFEFNGFQACTKFSFSSVFDLLVLLLSTWFDVFNWHLFFSSDCILDNFVCVCLFVCV